LEKNFNRVLKENDKKGDIFPGCQSPKSPYIFDINFISTGRRHINSKNAAKKHSWASASAFWHLQSQSSAGAFQRRWSLVVMNS
jgi:hypothetical protein